MWRNSSSTPSPPQNDWTFHPISKRFFCPIVSAVSFFCSLSRAWYDRSGRGCRLTGKPQLTSIASTWLHMWPVSISCFPDLWTRPWVCKQPFFQLWTVVSDFEVLVLQLLYTYLRTLPTWPTIWWSQENHNICNSRDEISRLPNGSLQLLGSTWKFSS